ncbi:MAG: hypothetical protein UHZ06_01720 [Paludibacteraceae bacterium]|nr:hypothetical protein [Paludibacteraceae bacterium]
MIKFEKLEKLDLVIACAAVKTVCKQTEYMLDNGMLEGEALKDAKRALKETKATYKKLSKILDKMDQLVAENYDEVLKNGI